MGGSRLGNSFLLGFGTGLKKWCRVRGLKNGLVCLKNVFLEPLSSWGSGMLKPRVRRVLRVSRQGSEFRLSKNAAALTRDWLLPVRRPVWYSRIKLKGSFQEFNLTTCKKAALELLEIPALGISNPKPTLTRSRSRENHTWPCNRRITVSLQFPSQSDHNATEIQMG